ncbi:Salicylaldehyde dehydrogenase [Trichoderma ghanense]|uniref:Salicylaldehyde dehydrogenase n=1 Tax=Trichoderma ghanense TaxID=65468 RepID=A0ABY2GWD9_9HYPO
MSFVQGPNGEQVIPIKIDGIALPVHDALLIPVESWKTTTHVQRRDLLPRTADVIDSWVDRFVEVQVAETGCYEGRARFNVGNLTRGMREIASHISHMATGELPSLEVPGSIVLVYNEPVGPVLAIPPWNAAMVLSGRGMAAPIGAGCSVMLKASELCPRTHHLIVQAYEEAGKPKGLINIVQAARGDGTAVTEAPVAHRSIRKIEFIGSAAVGRIIGQLSSKHLKPVLMELGGKAPAIVLKDADAKHAAGKIIQGMIMHHGQICMSTDRVVVVEDVAEELISELKMALATTFAGKQGVAVSKKQAKRGQHLLLRAQAAGARFIVGDASLNAEGTSLISTIVTDVKRTDEIFHEEIFSPAAILTIVKDEAEAIEAGQIHICETTGYDEQTLPIGGTKDSGWERKNGKYGFAEFLEEKPISIHDPAVSKNRFGDEK